VSGKLSTPFVAAVLWTAAPFLAAAQSASPSVDEANFVRGLVEPVQEAVISTEIVARIADLPFKEGQRFKAGDAIVVFDCERYEAQLKSLKARHSSALTTYRTNRELDGYGAIGKDEVDISRAEAASAGADAAATAALLKQCVISAPFNGRVAEILIHKHETPAASQELLRIVDDSALEIDLIVPSRWLRWLGEGAAFTFEVDETGQTYAAEVARIGAAVDPVSQTIKITARFRDAPAGVLPGMSGAARFTDPNG
jgi:RND family efflux transporter MFP subunit